MTNPKRRIMHEFKIDEISAVDRAAQQPARAVIMKNEVQMSGQYFSKAQIEDQLETLAKRFAGAHGVSLVKARADSLFTPEGQELYTKLRLADLPVPAAEVDRSAAAIRASADQSADAQHELDRLAKELAMQRAIPFATAYVEVLRTDKGSELYSTYRRNKSQ